MAAMFGGGSAVGAAAAAAGITPMCDRCFHHHSEADKCGKCGHYGRKVVFPTLTDKRPPSGAFNVRPFALNEASADAPGDFRLALLLRNRVFIKENNMRTGMAIVAASKRRTDFMEQDEHDPAAQHLLGMLGDAPVAYARWRVLYATELEPTAAADAIVVLVDRVLTLPEYRKRHFATTVMAALMQQVLRTLSDMPEVAVKVQRVSMIVPVSALCVAAAKLARKLGMQPYGETLDHDPSGLVNNDTFITVAECVGYQEFAITVADLAAAVDAAAAAGGDGADGAGDGSGGAAAGAGTGAMRG